MSISVALVRKLDTVAPEIRDVLLELIDEVEQHRETSVNKVEFNELKGKNLPLAPLIVTHFAHPKRLAQAEQEGITVVQSFEW